jgi:hypothetical protein
MEPAFRNALLLSLVMLGTANVVLAADAPTSIYGITLGQPLNLPPCAANKIGDMWEFDILHNPVTCAMPQWEAPGTDPNGAWMEVHFSPSQIPPLMHGDYISVWVSEQNVQDIMMITDGVDDQAVLLNQLVEKFGKTSSAYYVDVQNRMGAQFHVLHARWQLGGSNVRLTGAVDTLDTGELEAQTSLGAKMRADEAARIKRNTPQL